MSKFRIGDRVEIDPPYGESVKLHGLNVGTVTECLAGGYHVARDDDPDHFPWYYTDDNLELVEEPNPLKSGDRVRILTGFAKGPYGKVVAVYGTRVSVVLDGTCGESLYYAVDSVQYAPDQAFVLNRGDQIVNKITGRKGRVVEGQDEELWVVDESYEEETGAKAAAVEEYEQHYPNTYEITRKGPF